MLPEGDCPIERPALHRPPTTAADRKSHTAGGTAVERGMNVLALVKGTERYVFLYDDESARCLLQTLGRFAADTELSFTWYDAAILSQKVRRLREEHRQEEFTSQRYPELS
jgi:hypothetical protein